jgi:hypothetical protein
MKVNGQLQVQAPLPLVPIKHEVEWAPEPVWTFRRKIFPPVGIRIPGRPACGLVTMLTPLPDTCSTRILKWRPTEECIITQKQPSKNHDFMKRSVPLELSSQAEMDCNAVFAGKGKHVPAHAMNTYRRSRGLAPPTLKLSTTKVVSLTPRPLYPEEKAFGTHWTEWWVEPRASLDVWRRAGTLTPIGTRTPNHPVRSLVTTPRELYRLRSEHTVNV